MVVYELLCRAVPMKLESPASMCVGSAASLEWLWYGEPPLVPGLRPLGIGATKWSVVDCCLSGLEALGRVHTVKRGQLSLETFGDHLCQVWCLVEVAFQVKTVWHLHQAWGYLFTNKVETGCCLYWVEGHLARATRHGVCEPLKNLRKACIAIQDRLLVIVIAGGTAGRGSSWVSELGVSGNHQGRWMV